MSIKINSEEYKINRKIGVGGFGIVYKLQKGNNYYAYKQIPINNITKEIIDKYKEEVNILSKFNSEYIVKYYNSFMRDGYFGILMEYGSELNLKQFIQKYKDSDELIEENIIEKIIKQICSGLKDIHEANIIHRDLKPENIFINENNEIKIGDFGVSKKLSTNTKLAKTHTGKQHYNAPEIEKGQNYDQKVDVYALGCIIYELFTLNEYYIDKLDERSCKINTDIYNYKWQELLELLLQKNPVKRPNINQINEENKFSITILIVNLADERTIMKCALNMKVRELKNNYLNIINEDKNINDIDDCTCHFNGEILEDDKELKDYDIDDFDSIILVQKKEFLPKKCSEYLYEDE